MFSFFVVFTQSTYAKTEQTINEYKIEQLQKSMDEIKKEKTISYLKDRHIQKIFAAYKEYKDVDGFASVVSNETILDNDGTLSIPLYVAKKHQSQQEKDAELSLSDVYKQWEDNSIALRNSLNQLFSTLK